MVSELPQITYIHCELGKLFIGTGVPADNVAGSSTGGHGGAGSRLQQYEEEWGERGGGGDRIVPIR